jgi:hypothetical protein
MRSFPIADAIGKSPGESIGLEILFVSQLLFPLTLVVRKTIPPIAEIKAINRTRGGLCTIRQSKLGIYLLSIKCIKK